MRRFEGFTDKELSILRDGCIIAHNYVSIRMNYEIVKEMKLREESTDDSNG